MFAQWLRKSSSSSLISTPKQNTVLVTFSTGVWAPWRIPMHFGSWSLREYHTISTKALMPVSQCGSRLSLCIHSSSGHTPAGAPTRPSACFPLAQITNTPSLALDTSSCHPLAHFTFHPQLPGDWFCAFNLSFSWLPAVDFSSSSFSPWLRIAKLKHLVDS